MSNLRALPSVDTLMQTPQAAELITSYGRTLAVDAIRSALADIRSNPSGVTLDLQPESILCSAKLHLEEWLSPTLVSVINASGVILHTNLGRAPLSQSAINAIQSLTAGYASLEYDLKHGKRGSRLIHTETLLTRLTGAEAAMVVNNNASAILLALTALANRRRVVISRTQLVEVGGGFRIPDVMKQSGARLVEVGATNQVHLSDYEGALTTPAAAILRAHHSNFRIIGFTSEPTLAELSALAKQHGVYLIDDLGSGALLDTTRYGLAHEPTVQESVAAGADLVCFSGDKLLGGPQAGILVGRRVLINKLLKHPLARALRPDKLCLAALSATLIHYLKDEAELEIPTWQMISMSQQQVKTRAQQWKMVLGQGELRDGSSTIGGGSLPGETLPTCLLALAIPKPDQFLARLRQMRPPIIARILEGAIVLDPRTVLPEQEGVLLDGLQKALNG